MSTYPRARRKSVAQSKGVLFAILSLTQLAVAEAPAIASEVGATDVLYLGGSDWLRSDPERKLALAAAFMRIFCTEPRMSVDRLVICLDNDRRTDAVE